MGGKLYNYLFILMVNLGLGTLLLPFAAGVIDRDYRGNVGVVLFNLGKQEFQGRLL